MDLLTPPRPTSDAACYAVFAQKELRFDGFLFLGVRSTGIFCRPGCPARLPKFENCSFHITLVEDNSDLKVTHAALTTRGIDPSTARRQFLARFGMSFTEYARARRLGRAAKLIHKGGSILDAQLDAGFESASGFRAAYTKIFGQAPAKGNPKPLYIDWLETPMGRMIVIADEAATSITAQIETELAAYFAGDLLQFETPLATSGTEFQRQTWDALQCIPHGQTRSYAQLAEMIGKPKAVRAVASANANNGLALIIPCHRVIAKNGGLGGYAGGIDRKQDLLELESKSTNSKLA